MTAAQIAFAPNDLEAYPGAFWAVKRPLSVKVQFASVQGEISTREGIVGFNAGDAILTGVEGERWPVPRDVFDATYSPVDSLQGGKSDHYIKKPLRVVCLEVKELVEITLGSNRGTLLATPGDFIVQFGKGDLAVVSRSIFDNSYVRLDH